jgi:peptidoglycan hydrolase-like protein with peptidoglycan-binding domain
MLTAGMLISVAPGPVTAQSRPPAPAARPADPALDAARAAFEALPEVERKGLQDALVWTGDQVGTVDGSFGRQTYEGVIAFQRRLGLAPSGILDPKARTALLAEGQKLRQAAGFTLVDDPRTGVQIGIPDKRLPKRGTNPSGGSRWQSADGRITVDTRSVPAGEANLQSLYERNLAVQSPGRQVTYKVLRPEFFVISGETPTGRFYSRYAAAPDGLRGVSIGYDKSLGKEVERLVIAVANSFNPATAPTPSGSAAVVPAERKAEPAAAPVRSAFIGTGVFVGPGRIATTAPVEACATPRVQGRPARFIERKADGMLLLDAEGPAVAALPLRTDPADSDIPVVVLTYAASGDAPTLLVAPGIVRGQALSAPLQPPAQGSAIIDRLGHLIGLVSADEVARSAIAGTVPVSRYRISSAAETGLARVGGPGTKVSGSEMSAAALVANARSAVAPITCGP